MQIRLASLSLVLFFLATFIGCSTAHKNIERGSGYTFRMGYPEIRLSAIGIITEDDQPVVNTATELIINSLIFKREKRERVAEVLLEIRVIHKETGALHNYSETIKVTDNEELRASGQDSYQIEKNFEVEPGSYEVYVTVTDVSSQKDITVGTETTIPDPKQPTVNLTSILLLTKDNDGFSPSYFPTTTYDVPAKMDSLRFEFQVTNNDSDSPLLINANLVRFECDTLAAQPMSFLNYSPGTLRYKGINYRKTEEIASSTRRLTQPGSVYIEFTFPKLARGNYRFEVTTDDENGNEVYQAREFSVKSKNYPILNSVYELAAPLIYLMNEKDHRAMMSIKDNRKLKQAVDLFWLKNIGNPSIARQIIEKYYARVEEANKLFSTYKEGWKTDMGMMYILFGPPEQVFEDISRVMWAYTNNLYDPETNFYFSIPKVKNKYFPFEHYLLQRDNFYFNINYQQVQKWKTGTILVDRI